MTGGLLRTDFSLCSFKNKIQSLDFRTSNLPQITSDPEYEVSRQVNDLTRTMTIIHVHDTKSCTFEARRPNSPAGKRLLSIA